MLARAAEAAGDVAAAEKAYKELMLKSPSMEVKYHYAHFLYQQGRDAESRSLLEASLVEGRRLPTHARKLNKEWLDRMSEALRGF
ncbi:MAG: hypothetical protein HXY22_10470 [Alphaproteobacteria bacterium]|nr:hypothetical protein [Alphaproteobacteria bacterium]